MARRKKVELISYEALLEAAADLRLAIIEHAPYPAIANIISLGKVEKRKTGLSVAVEMDLSVKKENGGAPYARAFDKGSGLHGSKRKKYRIDPVDATALAFHWVKGERNLGRLYGSISVRKRKPALKGKVPKFLGRTEDGRLAFTHVDHPGVRGTGYLKKALDAAKPEIVQTLKADVGTNARLYFRQVVKELNKR